MSDIHWWHSLHFLLVHHIFILSRTYHKHNMDYCLYHPNTHCIHWAIIIVFMIAIEILFWISVEFISKIMALHHWAPQNLVVPVVFIVTLMSNAYLVGVESTNTFTADSPIPRTRISRFPTARASVFLSPRSARYHWQWS